MSPLLETWANASLRGFRAASGGGGTDFQLISTQILGTTAASVTFSSIPSTFRHLQIRMTTRGDFGALTTALNVRFNGDTAANYDHHWLRGTGSAATSNSGTSETGIWLGYTPAGTESASIFAPTIIDVLDYAQTTKNKTLRALYGLSGTSSSTYVNLDSGFWNNTAAVNSTTIYPTNGNFVTGSRFALYGWN